MTVSNETQPNGETMPQPILDNPITQYFDVGPISCTAGPGLIWCIHDATHRSSGKICSVFVFDKRIVDKLFKPKRRQRCLERIRKCIDQLEPFRHPRMLQIFHPIEEGPETLCFASEHVYGSLHNILAWHESIPREQKDAPIMPYPLVLHPLLPQMLTKPQPLSQPVPYPKEYHFLDFELCYGFLQLIEALEFMHYELGLIHRNVCPEVIIICKRGTWKLFGLEFVEAVGGNHPNEMVTVPPWSVKMASIAQPNLDYLAPEVQMRGQCNLLSDMFSLGLVICAAYNHGVSLLQANNNPILYMKQIESLSENVNKLVWRMPPSLQEAVQRLCMREPSPRPTTQLLPLIKYFNSESETAIRALQYFDVIAMKGDVTKTDFYSLQLMDALPLIPSKLRWQMVWPVLMGEIYNVKILQAAINPMIWIACTANHGDFSRYVTAPIKYLLTDGKNIDATVEMLEKLGTLLKKCPKLDLHNEILPIYYDCFDSHINEIQTSTLVSLLSVAEYIDDRSLHKIVLMKVRTVLEKNTNNVKITCLVIGFFEQVISRLDRSAMEHVVPTLLAMRLHYPGVLSRIIKLYRIMLNDGRIGLSTDVIATQMIPALAPHTVNPNLNIDEFTNLMEILYDMLGNIEQNQRLKMKVDAKNASGSMRSGSRLLSNDVIAPPFTIPNLRVEQRKTSSAEDVIRKNSVTGPTPTGSVGGGFKSTGIGQWFFGSNNSNNDNNFLRVISIYQNRRLSDNTMIHKNRLGPSLCSSSPGNTPRGSVVSGGSASTSAGLLPARRHSSIGPQERERRGSTINMSPAAAGQGHQQRYTIRGGSGSILTVPENQPGPSAGPDPHPHAASVPFLLTSSSHSIRSRRPSAAASTGAGSSLLQHISSGMVRHLPRPPPSMTHSAAWSPLKGALQQTAAMAVRKCPSLNITVSR